jgi:PAS domain S-box-containing protein
MVDELRRLLDTLPGLIWTARSDGHADFINARWCEYTGLRAEDALGPGWQAAFHPDDLQRVGERWAETVASGRPGEVEARLRRFDGQYRWFLLRSCPLADAGGNIVKWCGINTDIDDRKRAEQRLHTLESNLREVIDTIPALAWSALADGSAEFFNQHYLDYVGMTLEQVRGWGWSVALHPDDRAELAAVWQRILASGKAGEIEARLRRFDGEYRWFLFRTNPLRDTSGQIVKWYGTNTDIDDRKRATDELRRNQAFLAEGQRLNQTGTFTWLLEPEELEFSEQLYRIFEFEPGSPLTVERIAGRVHPEDVPLVSANIALARQDVVDFKYDCRLCMPDGSIRYLRIDAVGSRNRQGRLEYVGAMQDITERRLAEEALSKVRSELAHMTRVASLGALTASIAHEVNQPLAGIITNANACLRKLGSDPPNVDGARDTARRTIRDANRASDVISRLRALFAKKDPAAEVVDLNEATREVLALSSSELQRGRVVLSTELADDLPAVLGDRVQLQQVILNLLLNASAAMSGVDDRPRRLSIATQREEGDRVRLTVRDSGVGFDPRMEERLFESFYSTKSDGMGLGLSVSLSIIERHHGELRAAPNHDHGSAFSFSLPAARLE